MTRSPAPTGGSRPVVRFLRTFLIALVGIVVVVAVGSRVLGALGPDYGALRPTPATLRGYDLSYRIEDGAWTPLAIDDDGKACDALAQSPFLRDSCVLALNVDPRWIATPAYGTLNTRDTPSAVAITWRAVMANDPELCVQGGLLDSRLQACQSSASAGRAENSDGVVSVVVTAVR